MRGFLPNDNHHDQTGHTVAHRDWVRRANSWNANERIGIALLRRVSNTLAFCQALNL